MILLSIIDITQSYKCTEEVQETAADPGFLEGGSNKAGVDTGGGVPAPPPVTGYRESGGALQAPPVGPGAKPQPLFHFCVHLA